MTPAITEEAVRALADGELAKVGEWIAEEQRARGKWHKEQKPSPRLGSWRNQLK